MTHVERVLNDPKTAQAVCAAFRLDMQAMARRGEAVTGWYDISTMATSAMILFPDSPARAFYLEVVAVDMLFSFLERCRRRPRR